MKGEKKINEEKGEGENVEELKYKSLGFIS